MSGTVPATGPLNPAERVKARKYLGYAAAGNAFVSQSSWRFMQPYGFAEFRLNNLTEEELVEVRNYLLKCDELEAAVLAAGDNLDTDKAAVWYRNRHEVGDRERLLKMWRRKLCSFLGVSPGPGLSGSQAGRIIV